MVIYYLPQRNSYFFLHQGQVIYIQNQQGTSTAYVVTQGAGGVPVAVPAQNQMHAVPATQVSGVPVVVPRLFFTLTFYCIANLIKNNVI